MPLLTDGVFVFEDQTFRAEGDDDLFVFHSATVTFRRCRFEGATTQALRLRGGQATFEDCVWAGNRVGVHATDAADVTIRRSRIEGPAAVGLLFRQRATGVVDDCAIAGCTDTAVLTSTGATPQISRCTLESANVALYAQNGGLGELRDCVLRGGSHGVVVGASAAPTLWDCRIEGGGSTGLNLEGRGHFERCRLEGNSTGIYLMAGADPLIRDCDVQGGACCGVLALDGARGVIEACRVGPHPAGAVVRMPGASTEVRG